MKSLWLKTYELCTYFKHHKLKLYLFLAGMREYRDELQNESISVNYFELSSRNKGESYVDSLIKFLKKKKLSEINIFEIEDKGFEEEFLNTLKGCQCKSKCLQITNVYI